MASGHLSIDDFFTHLNTLFDSRRKSDHGSIYLTQKRLTTPSASTFTSTTSPRPPSLSSSPLGDLPPAPLLIRATNGASKPSREKGEKIKLSTIVPEGELERFFERYAECLKSGMGGLKKRDRSGRKGKMKKERERRRKEGGIGEEKKKS